MSQEFETIPHEVRVVGGVVLRKFNIPRGTALRSHMHPYDHLSFLESGEAALKRDGTYEKLIGPRMVEIKANIEHELYAHTDCVWDCLHALEIVRASGDPTLMEGVA